MERWTEENKLQGSGPAGGFEGCRGIHAVGKTAPACEYMWKARPSGGYKVCSSVWREESGGYLRWASIFSFKELSIQSILETSTYCSFFQVGKEKVLHLCYI